MFMSTCSPASVAGTVTGLHAPSTSEATRAVRPDFRRKSFSFEDVTLSKKQADRLTDPGGDDVKPTVAVEVGDGDGERVGAGAHRMRRAEGSLLRIDEQ